MFALDNLPEQCSKVFEDPIQFINSVNPEQLKLVFSESKDDSIKDFAISFSISSLLCFIVQNFTGPSIENQIDEKIKNILKELIPTNFKDDLKINGEELSHLASLPEFIWIPFVLMKKYDAPKVWLSRTCVVLQKCLTGPSEILQNMIFEGLSGIELAISYRLYHQYAKFLDELEAFRQSIQFDSELVGIMGKKTKFQQDSKAQLILKVNNSAYTRENSVEANEVTSQMNEREVHLEEDTHLLERPDLDDSNQIPPLTDTEICFLLLESQAIGDRQVSETKDEKRIPLLQTILQTKAKYSIVTVALFNKSILEKKNLYTQQRASIQLESIISDFNKETPNATERLKCFFMLEHPPLWEIRREMGMQMLMIGAAKSAANIFIEHKMWDELAMACQVTKDPQLALQVLEKEEKTPLVLCIIGEFKEDKELLVEAWELSKQTFSRAQRSLARIYLHAANWEQAAESYNKALALNKLYPDCWFSLGCSLMNLNKFEEAVYAFQQVVSLKQDDSESLSNLAVCLQQLKKYQEAHNAITQAVRFDRKSIKLWENYIIISLNNDLLNDALHGIEEVQRSNNKWCNTPLLYEVLQDIIHKNGDIPRFIKCMEIISQNADCGFDFWIIFADLCEAYNNNAEALDMRNTVLKLLEKDGKVREVIDFKRIVDAAEKLVQTTKKVIDKKRGTIQRIKVLVKKYEDDFSSLEEYSKLQSLLNEFD